MTFADPPSDPKPRPPRRPRQPPAQRSNRRSPLATTIIALGALAAVMLLVSQVWTEIAWYDQLGFRRVWVTRLGWQAGLFVVGALLVAVPLALNLVLAYRSRPVYAAATFEEMMSSLERYRSSVDPLRRLVVVALPVVLGLFAGMTASQQWRSWLLFLNAKPFGTDDPEFGLDVGFYVFRLPFLQFLVGFGLVALIISLAGAVVTHYLYGGIRLVGPSPRTTVAARRQVGILAALVLLLQGASYWLDRYAVLSQESQGELMTGASYAGVNAVLPAQAILTMLAIVVAITFLIPVINGNWRIPAVATALLMVASIAVGLAYPAAVQQFQVRPSQLSRERPYLARNIEATRAAYDIADVDVIPFTPTVTGARGALVNDAQTTASIRLLDPALVSPAFRQLERNKQYYDFPSALDVDRYPIDGQVRDTVIAVRELNQAGLSGRQNWVNQHIVYTHGYGVVAAYGNQRAENGDPDFFQRGIPSSGPLGEFEQRIYFGEQTTMYSIVGGPEDGQKREIDYPADSGEGANVVTTTFAGDGGPSVGNLFSRLMFALKFRDQNILLSGDINSESQILYDRTPLERVLKVAPYLTLDGDPYPAVVDGRVVWIVDGFTTTDKYPYSQKQALSESTRDTLTETTQIQTPTGEINYIRNSVKATVDAYDGKVTLYAWDEQDPILQAWQGALPGTVKPMSDVDGALMSHLRYPEDLFKVQRDVIGRYHVTDAGEFFSGQDAWQTPADPTNKNTRQPPYYLTLQMPEQDSPAFSLTSTYIPRTGAADSTNALTGFLAANADAGGETGVRSDDYGKLRLLRLPEGSSVQGPGQIQNNFNSDTQIQDSLNVLRLGGSSEVKLGNLLTLPLGGGLLYVQPAYVQSKEGTTYPQLRKVLVAFGGEVGFADTLDEALDQVFGGDSGAAAGDQGAGTEGDTPGETLTAQQQLQQALATATAAIDEGQQALSSGDFAAYGVAQQKLADAIAAATAAEQAIEAGTPADETVPAPDAAPAGATTEPSP
ncbi:MAG: UPF0182 family protein [Actinomycetales bacterium]